MLLDGSSRGTADEGYLIDLAEAARLCGDDPRAALALARDLGTSLPRPGAGATRHLWEALATVACVNLTVARSIEPHLDALAILSEAEPAPQPPAATWGGYAAEGPGVRLRAVAHGSEGWRLNGVKVWCSLADLVTHALVTAWIDEERRGLFLVNLSQAGVQVLDQPWFSRGLTRVRSGPVSFTDAGAVPVGGPSWYLERDGFAWGARSVLREAASAVDSGGATGDDGALLALRIRNLVADAAERVLTSADHMLGPGPLTSEPDHADRVADLRIYLRQHHAERDAATLGQRIAPAAAS